MLYYTLSGSAVRCAKGQRHGVSDEIGRRQAGRTKDQDPFRATSAWAMAYAGATARLRFAPEK